MDIAKVIAETPLFEGLSPVQRDELARIAVDRHYRKDQVVFSDGDPGDGFFTVVSGRIKVFKISPEGKEQIFHFFGPGDVFGEVAVFTGCGYPANAEAQTKAEALFFPRDAFIGLIKRDPSLALNMLATLSWRLHKFSGLIEDLSLREVPSRLAAHLLYLSDCQKGAADVQLEITKGQLAALIGTIPETLSRIMTKMMRQGLIKMDRNAIRITDRHALEELARAEKKLS